MHFHPHVFAFGDGQKDIFPIFLRNIRCFLDEFPTACAQSDELDAGFIEFIEIVVMMKIQQFSSSRIAGIDSGQAGMTG